HEARIADAQVLQIDRLGVRVLVEAVRADRQLASERAQVHGAQRRPVADDEAARAPVAVLQRRVGGDIDSLERIADVEDQRLHVPRQQPAQGLTQEALALRAPPAPARDVEGVLQLRRHEPVAHHGVLSSAARRARSFWIWARSLPRTYSAAAAKSWAIARKSSP